MIKQKMRNKCMVYKQETMHLYSTPKACGVRVSTIQGKYLKILDFRHFERVTQFERSAQKTYKKAISDGIDVSVVIDVECGNIPHNR